MTEEYYHPIIWDVTSCGLVEDYQCFREAYGHHFQGRILSQESNMLACFLNYSSTLKTEEVCSSEPSITKHHISGDCTLQSHRREDFKYNITKLLFYHGYSCLHLCTKQISFFFFFFRF
jgi:hypothetical protein